MPSQETEKGAEVFPFLRMLLHIPQVCLIATPSSPSTLERTASTKASQHLLPWVLSIVSPRFATVMSHAGIFQISIDHCLSRYMVFSFIPVLVQLLSICFYWLFTEAWMNYMILLPSELFTQKQLCWNTDRQPYRCRCASKHMSISICIHLQGCPPKHEQSASSARMANTSLSLSS